MEAKFGQKIKGQTKNSWWINLMWSWLIIQGLRFDNNLPAPLLQYFVHFGDLVFVLFYFLHVLFHNVPQCDVFTTFFEVVFPIKCKIFVYPLFCVFEGIFLFPLQLLVHALYFFDILLSILSWFFGELFNFLS